MGIKIFRVNNEEWVYWLCVAKIPENVAAQDVYKLRNRKFTILFILADSPFFSNFADQLNHVV